MSIVDEARLDREDLARVLKKHAGIRRLVEELYPDSAHFIYELLQNAEDTSAHEANFFLSANKLVFEHNGRPFEHRDVYAITDIGEGAKVNDVEKIGRFGVGFKAVFAYTETPHIWSPTFSFKISDLVLPTPLEMRPDLGSRTRFEFPFDNPKKALDDAYSEIRSGLNELTETTLLFLSHLESIGWQADGNTGLVRRIQHSHNHFEVMKQLNGKTTTSFHFLKFDKAIEGLEKQRIAIAFVLDFLPGTPDYDHRKPLAKQVKIIPVPGKVAVYFPAAKETSGLRFHLHGPFVPELSRASVKETPANLPLFEQLSKLTASSLHGIRDLGLLSGDFLAVLPNPQDAIPARYECIRTAVIDEMNASPLTPTHDKSHAPAKQLLQARAALKDLLTRDDLAIITGSANTGLQWAMGATQRNTDIDRFLAGLAITDWDTDKFLETLETNAFEGSRHISTPPYRVNGPDTKFMEWITNKSLIWHQDFYALLYEHISAIGWRKTQALDKLKSLRIVRRSDGSYGTAKNSYFPSDDIDRDDLLPRVDRAVYTSGRSKNQQQNARKFLEDVGVREVGEAEQCEKILELRYNRDGFKPLKQDLKRFIALWEADSSKSALFLNHFIFERKDGKWGQPSQVFLDAPFRDTGLAAYYEAIDNPTRLPLADRYQDGQIGISKLAKFAEAVGVQTQLAIETVSCVDNPDWPTLCLAGGDRQRSPINRDYSIPHLANLLAKPSLEFSKLLWRTMSSLPKYPNYLQATYQKNERYGSQTASSQLVHQLRLAEWVPQIGGAFARPSNASRDLLPEGFAFDPGWEWLKAIQFGVSLARKSEEQKQTDAIAKKLGFADPGTLERAQRFANLPAEEQERILADEEFKIRIELPDHESANVERRAQRVADQAAKAPQRRSEERTRSVAIGLESVKEQAAQYLLNQYTTDGEMICQVCQRPVPFKLDDGTPYFEKIEFLPELKNRHYQNYVALCPNHAAMFLYANGSSKSMQSNFLEMTTHRLPIVLAQKDVTIYFTKTHTADLRSVIETDSASESEGDPSTNGCAK